jgi:hypothetical protein
MKNLVKSFDLWVSKGEKDSATNILVFTSFWAILIEFVFLTTLGLPILALALIAFTVSLLITGIVLCMSEKKFTNVTYRQSLLKSFKLVLWYAVFHFFIGLYVGLKKLIGFFKMFRKNKVIELHI